MTHVLNGLEVRDGVVPLLSSFCQCGGKEGDGYTRSSVHPGARYSLSKTAANSVTLSQAKVLALSPSPCLALNFANMHEY